MRKKITNVAAVYAAVLVMTSCSITTPLTVSSNQIGKKQGEAKATIVFGLCFGGDYSILTAAKNGGITKVSTADVKYTNILGIYMTRKTVVTGE